MRRWALITAAVALVGAGCASGDEATAPSTSETEASSRGVAADELWPGLEVLVEYPRYLQAQGRELEVAVRNGGEAPIEVRSVALRSALFEDLPAEARQASLRVGQRTDYKVGFGDTRCDGDRSAHAVALTIAVDGAEQDALVAVDPEPLLGIADAECGALAVRAIADIGLGPDFVVDGDVIEAPLSVSLRPGEEGPLRVESMRGSVILAAEPAGGPADPLVAVDGDGASASVPVRLWAARWDPHGVAESKRTFDIPVWVSTGPYQDQFVVLRLAA